MLSHMIAFHILELNNSLVYIYMIPSSSNHLLGAVLMVWMWGILQRLCLNNWSSAAGDVWEAVELIGHGTWLGVGWGQMDYSGWVLMFTIWPYFLSRICFPIYPDMREQPHTSANTVENHICHHSFLYQDGLSHKTTNWNKPFLPWVASSHILGHSNEKGNRCRQNMGWVHVTDTDNVATVHMRVKVSPPLSDFISSGHTFDNNQADEIVCRNMALRKSPGT